MIEPYQFRFDLWADSFEGNPSGGSPFNTRYRRIQYSQQMQVAIPGASRALRLDKVEMTELGSGIVLGVMLFPPETFITEGMRR